MKIKVITKKTAAGGPGFEYRPGYFFSMDAACDDYDWLVVFDELPDKPTGTIGRGFERLACPRENTILATWEPTSIKCYTRAYSRQFAHLLSNRPRSAEQHPGYHFGRGYFWWFNGRTYDECASLSIPGKTSTVSAVCSAKAMKWTRHAQRVELMRRLAEDLPGMDWFGRGVRPLGKKYEAMDSYKYHVAVENHIAPGYWTEKIADAFLCGCLPFYAGDPDIGEVFPEESFIPIPIDDPSAALEIIRRAIDNGEYEKRKAAVLEARRLVLEKYNFWSQVIEIIDGAEACAPGSLQGGYIYSRKTMRRKRPSSVFESALFHLKQYLPVFRR